MGHSGARGTLIYEKNLKLKISCQTPFKYSVTEMATGNPYTGTHLQAFVPQFIVIWYHSLSL